MIKATILIVGGLFAFGYLTGYDFTSIPKEMLLFIAVSAIMLIGLLKES